MVHALHADTLFLSPPGSRVPQGPPFGGGDDPRCSIPPAPSFRYQGRTGGEGFSHRNAATVGLGLCLPPDATPEASVLRVGGEFAEAIRAIMTLPLTVEEKAEAVRRLMAVG
jgi:hypothetical protein